MRLAASFADGSRNARRRHHPDCLPEDPGLLPRVASSRDAGLGWEMLPGGFGAGHLVPPTWSAETDGGGTGW